MKVIVTLKKETIKIKNDIHFRYDKKDNKN